MYTIETKTLKDYVSDEGIKMPRFQRSEVWNEKQKFDLVLSICKDYPVGSVILCCEENRISGITEKWLIDGRQRFSTSRQIRLSPDSLWLWAKRALKVNDKTPDDELCEAFSEYLQVFSNYDKAEHEDDPESIRETDEIADETDDSELADSDELSEDDGEENEDTQIGSDDLLKRDGLSTSTRKLLELLLFCKNNRKGKNYGLTQAFNFEKYIVKSDKFARNFFVPGDSKKKISGEKTLGFIDAYKRHCLSGRMDYKTCDNYLNFVDDEYEFKDQKTKIKYENLIRVSWESHQLKAIAFYEWAESILSASKLGVISVTGASAGDEQKIFSLINSNGSPLSAAQILSAKPAWNAPISGLDVARTDSIKKVYKYLRNDDVDFDNCVKWDLPACLFIEIRNGDILFPFSAYKSDEKKIGKAITLGFKILSGLYLNRITKDAYDDLSDDKHINNADFSDFVVSLNEMLAKMGGMTYFSTLNSWKLTLSSLIGENATLYFMLAAYHMYLKSGRASAGTTAYRFFEKNIYILLDGIIMEYITSVWKGSSDSLLSNKLKTLKSTYKSDVLLDAIPTGDWLKVLNEIMNEGTIQKIDIKFDLIKPLVMHYFCTKGERCSVSYDYTAEFDHIIPQALFATSSIKRKEVKRDSIYNVGLLPKSINASKNDRTLNEISSNNLLVNAVIQYEEIERDRFDEFSSVTNWEKLKDYRGPKILKAFEESRKKTLEE